MLWVAAIGLAGCEANAELGLVLGPAGEISPLAAQRVSGQLRLDFVLADWRGQPLGGTDRIRSTGGTIWLSSLRAPDLQLAGLRLRGPAERMPDGQPTALRYAARRVPTRWILLLDNGQAAAQADPSAQRVSASRLLVDRVLCVDSGRCAFGASSLTLVILQDGAPWVALDASADRDAIGRALAELPRRASGEAPSWGGLLVAAEAARVAVERGDAAAVLLYRATVGTSPDPAVVAKVQSAFSKYREVPIWLVQQTGSADDLWPIVEESGGAVQRLQSGQSLAAAFAAASCASVGHWEAETSVSIGPPLPSGDYQLEGTLTLALGAERRAAPFDIPLTLRW